MIADVDVEPAAEPLRVKRCAIASQVSTAGQIVSGDDVDGSTVDVDRITVRNASDIVWEVVGIDDVPAAVCFHTSGVDGLVNEDRGVIVLLSLGFGLGTSTSSAATTFYVASAAASGSTPQFAGTMLAVASFAAIGSRVLAGIISDRIVRGHLAVCAGLIGTGSIGVVLLSSGTPTLMSIGVVIALIGCWGFNGVFWFALVRAYPEAPGRITGAVAPGGLIGSTIGPLYFGIVAEGIGFQFAWLSMAAVAVVAAGVLLLGGRRLGQRQVLA